MAHSLGLDVVAEGVETQEQLDYLREQRCDEVQGHFVSAPIDGDRLFKFLLDRKAAAENKGEVREFPLRRPPAALSAGADSPQVPRRRGGGR